MLNNTLNNNEMYLGKWHQKNLFSDEGFLFLTGDFAYDMHEVFFAFSVLSVSFSLYLKTCSM